MDLKLRMEMAGRNLLGALSESHGYLPYWNLHVDEDHKAKFNMTSPSHNIGRWWDAILRLEDATGFLIPDHQEEGMLRNTQLFFGNPDQMCFAPIQPEYGEPIFETHSLREGLLALNALVRYRGSEWAAEQGHRMLETVARLSDDDGNWDWNGFDYRTQVQKVLKDQPEQLEKRVVETGKVESHGRLIEALVWFYETTRDSLALDLAGRFSRYHLANSVSPDGKFNSASNSTHTHSYLGMLRGLLSYGITTNQHEYIDIVAATYKVTIPKIVKESGWACHDLFSLDSSRGETASPGDSAQIGLWLARDAGYSECLDDVERIVRSRLLPSQITDPPGIVAAAGEVVQNEKDLQNLAVGAIGGMHKGPHSHKANTTDVTAACLHTLIDVYNNIVVPTDTGLAVYFHFDYKDHNLSVSSTRGQNARLTVESRTGEDLLIRIPRWVPAESLQFLDDGNPIAPSRVGDFAYFSGNGQARKIDLSYDLPERNTTEKIGKQGSTTGSNHAFKWRGDEIISICPSEDWLPFYETTVGRI